MENETQPVWHDGKTIYMPKLVQVGPTDQPDKRVTLRIPPDLYQKIADCAEMAGVPVNWWIVSHLGSLLGQRRYPRPRQLG